MTAAAAILASAPIYALDVESDVAGSLHEQIDNTEAATLSVSGQINAADLYYISENMTSLRSLDLSGATIVAYDGELLRLRSHYDAATIPPMAFAGSKLTTLSLPRAGKTTLSDGALASSPIENIDLSMVDSIGMGAFTACNSLKSVTIPTTHVGSYAFADCGALASVDFGVMEKVPEGSFARCGKLAETIGSEKLTSIGNSAFAGCKSLTAFTFGTGLYNVGNSAFEFTGLQDVNMADCYGLRGIGERSFASCPALSKVVLGDNCSFLGDGCFFEDSELSEVKFGDRLDVLPQRVFKGASKLSGTIELPEGVNAIGSYAMKDAVAVDSIILPASLSHIGNFAMENMSGLKGIDASRLNEVPNLGVEVWRGVSQPEVRVTVKNNLLDEFQNAAQWEKFKYDAESGVEGITGTEVPSLSARFSGNDLLVSAGDTEIDRLELYDIAGRLLVSVEPSQPSIIIDTTGIEGNVFIISAQLAGNRRASLKLAR